MKNIFLLHVLWITAIALPLFAQVDQQKRFPFRELDVDMIHVKLELEFDFAAHTIRSRMTSPMVALRNDLRAFALDAEDMTFTSVKIDGVPVRIDTSRPAALTVFLPRPCQAGDTLVMVAEYQAVPKKGMFFIDPDSTNSPSPHQVWTQGESENNHHWFPCNDTPNEKVTSEIIARVRQDFVTVSNGRLVAKREDPDGTITWHWLQDKPHSIYLVAFIAGNYVKISDTYHGKPVAFYAYPWNIEDAANSFSHTIDALKYFSNVTGVEYPWDKYDQIILRNFMYGGMENTSVTTLTEHTIHSKRSEIDGRSSVGVMAHELAHQWFGDLVTTRSWSHIWLNESFATYFEALFQGHLRGQDQYDLEMMQNGRTSKASARSVRMPIVFEIERGEPDRWPIANVYQKGSVVLHMLRNLLGDRLWWKGINLYLRRFAFSNAETYDFRRCMEEVSSRDLRWFFDEWVYGLGYPEYVVRWSWDDESSRVNLRVRQSQEVDSVTGFFVMPVPVVLHFADSVVARTILVDEGNETFAFALKERPLLVEFDPGNVVLKDLAFSKSIESFAYQLEHGTGFESRLTAIDSLAVRTGNKTAYLALKACALSDNSRILRRRAASALRRFDSELIEPDVVRALASDPNPRVRVEGIRLMTAIDSGDFLDLAESIISGDSSIACVTAALKWMSVKDTARFYKAGLHMLGRDNEDPGILSAAIDGFRIKKDPRVRELVVSLAERHPNTNVQYHALKYLADLFPSATETNTLLLKKIQAGDGFLSISAARIIGKTGTPDLIPALEAILNGNHGRFLERTIEHAIRKIKERKNKPRE
ncbi:MAG: M1 family metallopeptidase [Chlorobi bacterium]|nr:M1 family metallopeptidase [Chlorobiota bacterium]